jgi:hypothetical protein
MGRILLLLHCPPTAQKQRQQGASPGKSGQWRQWDSLGILNTYVWEPVWWP